MYTEVYLRLEPLGLERVGEACRRAGHEVRLLDLQIFKHKHFRHVLETWRPDAVAFSLNYLANIPEVIDLARLAKDELPDALVFVGGHSASFTAREILGHADGAIDCVVKGEGEEIAPKILTAWSARHDLGELPGVVTMAGEGPPAAMIHSLDEIVPARDLVAKRRKYFIGVLDPCASVEFSRGCPWNCTFCSAWTFYGRSYRLRSPERVAEDMAAIREPGVFIVDDVAFVREEHGMAIADAIERRGIRKTYYLETRADVLLRHKAVFARWRKLGLKLMFLGLEAIDEEGLKKYRKRVGLGQNFEALDYARSLGINVAINIIADPDWDHARFETVRQWCLEIPYVVNISVNTPYPGTETWLTEARRLTSRDYRLFDIQHCVLPTKLPLDEFYRELVTTQLVLNRKHLGLRTLFEAAPVFARLLARGQTNFIRSMFAFRRVYNADALFGDHGKSVAYELPEPEPPRAVRDRAELYVHKAPARARSA